MKKLLNKKGFTLMEMMIVVAIIVILVAISIPTFSSSLHSAKEATDKANLRSAKAAVALKIAEGETEASLAGYAYNITTGEFDKLWTAVTTDDDKKNYYGECDAHDDAHIVIDGGEAVWADKDGNEVEECTED